MKLQLFAAMTMLGLIASCTTSSVPGQTQSPAIVIASDLPISGPNNLDVTPLRDAIQLAVNDHGPMHGFRLVYEPLDTSLAGFFNLFKGEQNAKIMARQPQVVGVVGPYNSTVARLEIPITNQAGLVMISPTNTADCLTSSPPCVQRPLGVNTYFRVAATDSAQASTAATFAVEKLKLTQFAVLSDGTSGESLADAFTTKLQAAGGRVVFRQTYSTNASDYTALVSDARARGAEAVFVSSTFINRACSIRAAMSGIFPPDAYLISGDAIVDSICLSDAADTANEHLLAMVSSSQPPPNSKVFQEFRAHGIRPTTYVFGAYDCAEILISAIDRAMQGNGGKVPSRQEVLNAIASARDFIGASGTFTFLPSGDPTQPALSVYRVQNGHWTFWQNAT